MLLHLTYHNCNFELVECMKSKCSVKLEKLKGSQPKIFNLAICTSYCANSADIARWGRNAPRSLALIVVVWYAVQLCFCNYKRWLESGRIKEVVICQSWRHSWVLDAPVNSRWSTNKIQIGAGFNLHYSSWQIVLCIMIIFIVMIRAPTGCCSNPITQIFITSIKIPQKDTTNLNLNISGCKYQFHSIFNINS